MKLLDSYMNSSEKFFRKEGNVVFDDNTGLCWEVKSCVENDINYGGNTYSYEEAPAYIESLNNAGYGGYSDWRLPNMDEIRTLADYSRKNIVFDTNVFGDCRIGDYWSCNIFVPQPRMAWVLYSGFGSAIVKDVKTKRYVMAVRGGNDRRFGTDDIKRFVDNGDGTVTDISTGLMWQQAENPRASLEDAVKMCAEMTLAGYNDWRLPNIKEINTIQDLSYKNGSWFFDELFKAEGISGMFHYRAVTMFRSHYSWVTNFSKGYDGYYAGTEAPLLFRAVRTIDAADTSADTVYIKRNENDHSYCRTGGLTTDEKTGLIWNENYVHEEMTFDEAVDFVQRANELQLDGYSDWRLPMREELRSVICYDGRSPAVESGSFENITPNFLWNGQDNKNDNSLTWAFYMGYGCAVVMKKSELCGVILVRGGSADGYLMPSSERFTVNGDGTVTDKLTGLMWMQGETPLLTLDEAKEYCKKLDLCGFSDWYLPSMKELATIINITEGEKWFFEELFPDTNIFPQGFYMSSDIFDSSFGWGCNFQFGFDGYYADKTEGKFPFRPVRRV